MSTLGELADAVQDATLRGGENRTQIIKNINDSIREVDSTLRPAVTSVTKTLTANVGDYSLASAFLLTDVGSIRDITWFTPSNPTANTPLGACSPSEIRAYRTQSSNLYSTYVSLWALSGLDLLMLYPTTTSASDTITLYYSRLAVDLVAETEIPSGLPAQWHDLYVLCAIARAMRQTSPEYSLMYKRHYSDRLDDYWRWKNRRDGAISRSAYMPRGRRIPHDNSADVRY